MQDLVAALKTNAGPRDIATLPMPVSRRIEAGEPAVKVIREWRGISQEDLADRTGVAITQVMRAERGSDVSPAALRLMARGLRVLDEVLLTNP